MWKFWKKDYQPINPPPRWRWHNKRKKCTSIALPKCGSNSVRAMTGCDYGPNLKSYKGYTVFAVMREPMNRSVASFIEIMLPASDYPKGRYHHNLAISEELIARLDAINNGAEEDIFKRFVDLVGELGFFDTHIQPQHYFLEGSGEVKLYKLERRDALFRDFGVEAEVVINKTELGGVKKRLLDLLETDQELRSKVAELYAKDIALYESFDEVGMASL